VKNLSAIAYGGNEIVFQILNTDRKTMEIAVLPDCSVAVKVPKGTSEDETRARVYRRARWITRQINFFQQFRPRTPDRQYVGGETHLYLGRRYRLKISQGHEASVKLVGGFIFINCYGAPSPAKVKLLLDTWYLKRARIKFTDRLERSFSGFERMGCSKPNIQIRKMKTRWGSLSPKGNLTLNRDLIRAPRDCIDYVVTHELCHLKHQNHSKEFYQLLDQVMPDWYKQKSKLEQALI